MVLIQRLNYFSEEGVDCHLRKDGFCLHIDAQTLDSLFPIDFLCHYVAC